VARVILFDIDNTLLYTRGAGSHAMNVAFNEMFGVTDGFARVEFSGRTDRFILQGGLAEHGIQGGVDQHLNAFTQRYYQLLPESIAQRDGYLMPGFPELLAVLTDAGARLGLATGNFREAATIKLRHYGIDGYFQGGGFGEVSTERGDVVAEAIRNVSNGASPGDILVVGDTPHDITSAVENNVVAVGVATGNFTTEELSAAGAHSVFQDFADWRSAAKQLMSS
jgi:phosphoglycolate phosphatase-like HAD superfamily hydrolase